MSELTDEQQREADAIYAAIMPVVRGGVWERRLNYNTADKIAECVAAGARRYVKSKAKEEEQDGRD